MLDDPGRDRRAPKTSQAMIRLSFSVMILLSTIRTVRQEIPTAMNM